MSTASTPVAVSCDVRDVSSSGDEGAGGDSGAGFDNDAEGADDVVGVVEGVPDVACATDAVRTRTLAAARVPVPAIVGGYVIGGSFTALKEGIRCAVGLRLYRTQFGNKI